MKDVKQNSKIAVAEPNLNLHQNPNLNTKKVENADIQPFCNEKKNNKCFFENVKNIEAFFNSTKTFALAFCVSEDLGMDDAVAVQFNTKFNQMHKIYEQGQKEGGLAILQINGRFIYYLITRKRRDGKATTNAMLNSLQKLQQHIQKHNVKNLAILRLGCDLDCFKWIAVRGMIEHTFEKTAVKITIYNSERPEEDTKKSETIKCLTWHVSCPLTDMHSGAAIIYFGTVNGHISKEIHSLDMQFQIMGDYVRANKMLGDVIQCFFIIDKVGHNFTPQSFPVKVSQSLNVGLKHFLYPFFIILQIGRLVIYITRLKIFQ
ncbi:hypothetical protein RN001_014834 [Aquatica leii]|uniref:Uncharacterized protein n=1 Tax=Aquatica leii TaxID=1421715 RepID=A0AAN7SNA4_9COLE|nr:hypothetical protein RN001_014834 [Aquatica leii]